MTRNDLPYVVLVAIFGLAIFLAGRMSAPVTVVTTPAIPSAPQVIVISSSVPAPAAAPTIAEKVEAKPAPIVAPVKSAVPSIKAPKAPEAPKPVPPIHVELEEDPVIANPYTKTTSGSEAPGF